MDSQGKERQKVSIRCNGMSMLPRLIDAEFKRAAPRRGWYDPETEEDSDGKDIDPFNNNCTSVMNPMSSIEGTYATN